MLDSTGTTLMRAAAAALLLVAGLSKAAAAAPSAPPQSCASGTPVTVAGVSYKTKFTVLKDGAGGAGIRANNTKVSAAVVGTLLNGASFWNSSDPPVAPGTPHPDWFDYSFVLPPKDGGLIVGFDVGSFGMTEGEVRELCIPAEEGYGSRARPGIPADSTLVFTLTCGKIAALKSDDDSASHASASGSARLPTIVPQRAHVDASPGTADCSWKYYPQPLSHFAEGSTAAGNATFMQRVCVIDKYWKAPSAELLPSEVATGHSRDGDTAPIKGPILFYTGNESPVDVYINNTGLMWTLAPKLGALMIFAEHR